MVETLFEEAVHRKIFHPAAQADPPQLRQSQGRLLERDLIRSHAFHVSPFGAESFTRAWIVIARHESSKLLHPFSNNDRVSLGVYQALSHLNSGVGSCLKRQYQVQGRY